MRMIIFHKDLRKLRSLFSEPDVLQMEISHLRTLLGQLCQSYRVYQLNGLGDAKFRGSRAGLRGFLHGAANSNGINALSDLAGNPCS